MFMYKKTFPFRGRLQIFYIGHTKVSPFLLKRFDLNCMLLYIVHNQLNAKIIYGFIIDKKYFIQLNMKVKYNRTATFRAVGGQLYGGL